MVPAWARAHFPVVMREGEPDQSAFEVPGIGEISAAELGEGEHRVCPGPGRPEVARVRTRAWVERRLRARPHSAQFSQEQLDGHRPRPGSTSRAARSAG